MRGNSHCPTRRTKRYSIDPLPSKHLSANNSVTVSSRFPIRSGTPTAFSKVAYIPFLPPLRQQASDLPEQLALLHLLNINHSPSPLPRQPLLRRLPARPLNLPRAPTSPRTLCPPTCPLPPPHRRIPPAPISARPRPPLHQQSGHRLPPVLPQRPPQCPSTP